MVTIIRGLAAAGVGCGVLLGAVAAVMSPAASASSDGLFSGTYSIAPYGSIVHVSSGCAQCDAVGTGRETVTMTWNGAGWQRAWVMDGCGPGTSVATPTLVTNGVVQELQVVGTGACPAANTTAVWSRIGD